MTEIYKLIICIPHGRKMNFITWVRSPREWIQPFWNVIKIIHNNFGKEDRIRDFLNQLCYYRQNKCINLNYKTPMVRETCNWKIKWFVFWVLDNIDFTKLRILITVLSAIFPQPSLVNPNLLASPKFIEIIHNLFILEILYILLVETEECILYKRMIISFLLCHIR